MFVNARAIIQREVEGVPAIYLQYRAKPGEPRLLELPGGRIEEFESIESALRREVREETGMTVSIVEPKSAGWVTARTAATEVECISVYAAYQTTIGPIDSIGFYFLCAAEGTESGSDESERGLWLDCAEIARRLREEPKTLSWVDQAGLKFHLQASGVTA